MQRDQRDHGREELLILRNVTDTAKPHWHWDGAEVLPLCQLRQQRSCATVSLSPLVPLSCLLPPTYQTPPLPPLTSTQP